MGSCLDSKGIEMPDHFLPDEIKFSLSIGFLLLIFIIPFLLFYRLFLVLRLSSPFSPHSLIFKVKKESSFNCL